MMSGLFASLSVGRAWEKLSSFLRIFSTLPSSSSSASQEKDLEELRKLERTMRRIRATLHDAEEQWNIREESAKLRLKELKDLAYNMEDVVDEYDGEVDRCRLAAPDRSACVHNTRKRKHQEEMEDCPVDTGVVPVPTDLVLRARKITERFNEIIHYSEHLSLSENDGERRFAPDITTLRHTSSVVFEKSILGREQDKDKIIDKLLSTKGENAGNPVSVMAIVGMGGLGKTTLAQLVYNSPRVEQSFEMHAWVCVSDNFDIKKMTRTIITSLTREQCTYTELPDLQRELADVMNESRVFLVLDDVWNERRDCWELFCAPMTAAKICQIIVTTRSQLVATLVQTMPFYAPNCLGFGESWSLFCKAALISEQESDIPTNLIKIGKSIVRKCKGLPLAIKTLGSMLRYENEERRWMDVLESELWDLKEPRDEILAALELSYRHMPVFLRRCFLCLSLFPKDYNLPREEVLRLWKLLDLLDFDGSDDECKIGQRYLNELVGRSILEPHSIYGYVDSYHLHDLVHDLACFFAGEEFHRVEGDNSTEIPLNARYLSINTASASTNPNALPKALRSIVLSGSTGISRLSNLTLGGIGHLMRLRTLPGVHISRHHCSLNIGELWNINKTRELSISVSNVHHAKYATEAQLKSKRHLQSLILRFDKDEGSPWGLCPCGLHPEHVTVAHDQLLDSLRPHHNLRELRIFDYNSSKYPNWRGDASFSMLSRLELGSGGIQHFPKLGGLPSLKYLKVYNMHNIQLVGLTSSRQLAELVFANMSEWSEWSGEDDGGFPRLNLLSLSFCPKLSFLPVGLFHSLVTLNLMWCDTLATFPESPTLRTIDIEYCPALRKIPTLPSLLELRVVECSGLTDLPNLPSLLELQISYCSSLISIGSVSSVLSFPKLATLKLKGCPDLCAVGSFPSLTTLNLMSGLNEQLLHNLSSFVEVPKY